MVPVTAGVLELSEALEIIGRSMRGAELNGHINAFEGFGRHACAVDVIELIETQDNFKVVFRRKLFDELAHLAVADEREFLIIRH